MILTFNTILLLILIFLNLMNQNFQQFYYSLLSLLLVLITFPLMKIKYIVSHHSDLITIYLILFPYFTGVYFFVQSITSTLEGFVGGFVFNMYLSFPVIVKMNWYKKFLIHLPAYAFVQIYYYMNCRELAFAFWSLLAIVVLNLVFNYFQDKMERNTYLIEHYFKKNNEVFQNIFTNIIPEEILIWKKSGLDFANKSAFELFQINDIKALTSYLLKNVEILDIEATDNDFITCASNKLNHKNDIYRSSFLANIYEILESNDNSGNNESNFLSFTAKINVPTANKLSKTQISTVIQEKSEIGKKKQEFDIKMKKFFWRNEEAVLILLNAVEERNLKSRLEFVNSYLNYLLANLSHEIYTPLNGLLGMLEVSISNLKDSNQIQENLKMARNSADFLLSITQDIFDFYNIRRGKLTLNISKISLEIFLKELLTMFSGCFDQKNIKIENVVDKCLIHSDPQKLKQILIGIINHIINNLVNPKISVAIRKALDFHVVIEIKATGLPINSAKIPENLIDSSPPLKISRHLAYDRRFAMNDGLMYTELGNFGSGDFELHLIHYLALCLAPEIDVPFQNKMTKSSDMTTNTMEYFYQIYISDIKENKTSFIEDLTHDKICFEAEYRVFDYTEFFESSDGGSPLLPKENERYDKLLKASVFQNFSSNSIIDERKSDDYCLKMPLKNYQTSRRTSCLDSFPTLLKTIDRNRDSEVSTIIPIKSPDFSVLNVDDNPINLMVISNYCKISGFKVIESINGLDAVEKAKKFYIDEEKCFDFIFMDCDMPVMNGFQACEELIKLYEVEKKKPPPIVAITANDTYEDRMKAKKCGMKELVKKPLSKSKFEELIAFWTKKT